MNEKTQQRVVIVGGGFGGIETAKQLARDKKVQVTLVTKNPYFEYYPALYKLVTGALAIEVCVPYEKIFRGTGVTVVQAEYVSHAPVEKIVTLRDGGTLSYDYLVLAMGSQTNYFTIPGIEKYAFSFKSAQEALALKQHFIELLQQSKDVAKDELVERFHVTIVGGGPSGVELAGDITTYLRRMIRRYHIDPSFVTVDLIESNSRVLATMPEKVSQKVEARLRSLKVNLYTNRQLQAQDLDEVSASGMTLQSGTVIWTAGTKIHDSFAGLPMDQKKRVSVTDSFSVKDQDGVFVIGDGAGAQGAGLAQGAIAHGTYLGNHILKLVYGKQTTPYVAKTLGYIVPVGHNWAVLTYRGITVSGFIPWILRSFVDFKYFVRIVPLHYVFAVFKQGEKYRRGEY